MCDRRVGLPAPGSEARAPRTTSITRAASVRFRVGAPGDVAVGPHQHEPALIGRKHLGLVDVDDVERNAARLPQPARWPRRRRVRAEPQQHEAAAEQVEGRAAVREPDVRRARAGPGGLGIGMR